LQVSYRLEHLRGVGGARNLGYYVHHFQALQVVTIAKADTPYCLPTNTRQHAPEIKQS